MSPAKESPGSFGASLGEELLRLSLLVPRVSEVHGIQTQAGMREPSRPIASFRCVLLRGCSPPMPFLVLVFFVLHHARNPLRHPNCTDSQDGICLLLGNIDPVPPQAALPANLIRQHALQSSQRLDGLAEQLRQVTATMDFQEADIALLTQRNAELEARLKGARAAHEEEGAAQRAAAARLELALQAMTAERDQCSAAVREVTAKWESSRPGCVARNVSHRPPLPGSGWRSSPTPGMTLKYAPPVRLAYDHHRLVIPSEVGIGTVRDAGWQHSPIVARAGGRPAAGGRPGAAADAAGGGAAVEGGAAGAGAAGSTGGSGPGGGCRGQATFEGR